MTTIRAVVLVAVVSVVPVGMLVSQSAATTIYGVAGDSNGVLDSSVFAIDPDAKTLTTIVSPLPGVGAALAPSPTSPTELFVSIVDATLTSRLYRLTIATGALSPPIGSSAAPIVSLGEGRDGFLYGTGGGPCCFPGSQADLYRIDPANGSAALMGTGAAGYNGDVAADAAGTLFGSVGGDLVRVNKTTGAQTVVGAPGGFIGLAFSLDGRLWGVSDNKLYRIDPGFATRTFIMDLPVLAGTAVGDLASEPGTPLPLPTPTPAAPAQCAFDHGKPTINTSVRLVQAFVPCGGNDSDGYPGRTQDKFAQGGIPACSPPVTYLQEAGSPPAGWRLDPATGRARLQLTPQTPTNVRVRLQLRDIVKGNGVGFAPEGSTGTLNMLIRATFDDPVNGDMTLIDFPLSFPIVITATGDADLDTTVNARLASLGLPPLPACTNFEVLEIVVLDPTGTKFLRPGHFRM